MYCSRLPAVNLWPLIGCCCCCCCCCFCCYRFGLIAAKLGARRTGRKQSRPGIRVSLYFILLFLITRRNHSSNQLPPINDDKDITLHFVAETDLDVSRDCVPVTAIQYHTTAPPPPMVPPLPREILPRSAQRHCCSSKSDCDGGGST